MANLNSTSYGYSVATNKTYVAIGNPYVFGGNSITGSVEVLKYCDISNQYVHYTTLRKNVLSFLSDIVITQESASIELNIITSESGSSSSTSSLALDDNLTKYIVSSSNQFGISVALYGDTLVVGNPQNSITLINGNILTGSSVDIYNLLNTSSVYTIENYATNTFGESVSAYDGYVVIASSNDNNTSGSVYVYKSGSGVYNLYQTLTGSTATSQSYFGGTVKIDQSGTYNIVVGNANKVSSSGSVYVFSYNTSSTFWTQTAILNRNTTITQSLEFFGQANPVIINNNNIDGYGNSVSIYGNNIVVGAPRDTTYLEFPGSSTLRYRGAVYFYQACNINTNWLLLQKSWGDDYTLPTNQLGYSVDIYNSQSVVSVVKNNFPFSSSYIANTLNKIQDCNPDEANISTLGQCLYYELSPISNTWNIVSNIKKHKKYQYPYLVFGNQSVIYNNLIVVGSPLLLTDTQYLTGSTSNNLQGYAYIYNKNDLLSDPVVGNVFYRNGKIVFSNSASIFHEMMRNPYDTNKPSYDIYYDGKITLYEKQVVCSIEPSEFNFSTNPSSMINNQYFSFKNLDYILKYMNLKINGNECWWSYVDMTDVGESLFNLYTENYNIYYEHCTSQIAYFKSIYNIFDIDGDNKINLFDMNLLWKFYTDELTNTDVFSYTNIKSQRNTLMDIKNYIKNNIIITNYGQINPAFFGFEYSSSIDKTGSYLAPYITTVGLYNGPDLVAVGKLGRPVKNGGEFPLNILVKWDI